MMYLTRREFRAVRNAFSNEEYGLVLRHFDGDPSLTNDERSRVASLHKAAAAHRTEREIVRSRAGTLFFITLGATAGFFFWMLSGGAELSTFWRIVSLIGNVAGGSLAMIIFGLIPTQFVQGWIDLHRIRRQNYMRASFRGEGA